MYVSIRKTYFKVLVSQINKSLTLGNCVYSLYFNMFLYIVSQFLYIIVYFEVALITERHTLAGGGGRGGKSLNNTNLFQYSSGDIFYIRLLSEGMVHSEYLMLTSSYFPWASLVA